MADHGLPEDPDDDDLHYVFENQVRYEETDAQGIVFYGNYVTYQDEAFSEFLRRVGYPWQDLQAGGLEFHVVHAEVDYHSFAEFDDWLSNGLRVEAVGESSVEFAYACRQRGDGRVVATGGLTHVAVDADGSPTGVPDGFRRAVREFQDVPPGTA